MVDTAMMIIGVKIFIIRGRRTHHDVYNQEEENTANRPKSIKEMEEEKAAEKAAQQK